MMEENSDIFFAGSDVLVYWTDECTDNIQQHLSGAIHLVRTFIMTYFLTIFLLHEYLRI